MQDLIKGLTPSELNQAPLRSALPKTILRFPSLFDERLVKGLERLIHNASSRFLTDRSSKHIRSLLLTQFCLQKKIEEQLKRNSPTQKHLFLKLFSSPGRICLALTYSSNHAFQKERIIKTFRTLLPGVREVPNSFYLWYHADYSYYFCYLEVYKLRGQEFSKQELKKNEKALQNQLLTISPLTPTLFWPYNKEESFRQLQLLQREITSPEDLPQVSIHFREQTANSLEFLLHCARPKSTETLHHALKKLPDSLPCFCQSSHENKHPLHIEMGVFSIKVPSSAFDMHDSINLLYARRYVIKSLEESLGVFRDFNGGLFEKQQEHFDIIRFHLANKIPHFDLFAEKLFYALNRIETWFSFSIEEAEYLFGAFSELVQESAPKELKRQLRSFTIIKTPNSSDLYKHLNTPSTSHAQITIGDFYYLCLMQPKEAHCPVKELPSTKKTLRFAYQSGMPPSFNPHYSFGDIRCQILNKLLFEGLTRLNEQGMPELAGAIAMQQDGLCYTFKLRPYRWSNGEHVTALDYVSSWRGALSDCINHPELLFVIKNAQEYKEKKCPFSEVAVKALDAETLQIQLQWPDPYFLHKLAQPFFSPLFGSLREPKWFNGPYLIREQTEEKILLERNPYFWDAERIYFDQIEMRKEANPRTLFRLFQQGEIDWYGEPFHSLSTDQIRELQKKQLIAKLNVKRQFVLYFNTKHPLLSSSFARKAFSLCLDRSYITARFFPYSLPSEPKGASKVEARQLMKKALKELGLSQGNTPPLTFSYCDPQHKEAFASYLQTTWQKTLGIPIQIVGSDWNHFRSNLEKKSYEICGAIQDIIDEDSYEYLSRFEGPNSWNFPQWSHPGYRSLIDQARPTSFGAQKNIAKQEAKNILLEETPYTPLFHYIHLYAQNPKLKNCVFDKEGCIDFSWAYLEQ